MSVAVADVQVLISTSLTSDEISAFISSAEAFYEGNLSGAGLSSTLQDEITKWLAAHMIATTRERVAIKEGAGGAEITYSGTFGEGLKSTSYGQMAISLDPSKTLLAIANGKKLVHVYTVPAFDTITWVQ